jgi:hypothetical protein
VSRVVLLLLLVTAGAADAQTVSQRGFIEGSSFAFPQAAPNDSTRLVGDLLVREEAFLKPAPWIQFAGGVDLRASSHDQVDESWRIDFADRGIRRPPLSVRRLTATLTRGRFTLDVGKQFIRWGKTDIVNPTDRFAPRDFLNVVNAEFLSVAALRAVAQAGSETFEVVWTPRLTPARMPLVNERWTAVPPDAAGIPIVDGGAVVPSGSQTGVRWGHTGRIGEYSLSFFDGFNYLPDIQAALQVAPVEIDVTRLYSPIRTYGADAAVPTRWFTLKGEAAYFTSSSASADEYVLWVAQIERQTGEWVLVGGYAGEALTRLRSAQTFAPDRGLSRAIVARASYTIDPIRSVAIEGAVRQNGRGAYTKVEYSQARGLHWRATLTVVGIRGESDDFLGQYRRNSHVGVTLRYSF